MITTITGLEEMCDLMCDNRLPGREKGMNREDATWIMQMCKDRDARTDCEKAAYDMAIEALQAKTDGDLISREDVLNMIIVAGECEPDLGYTHLHDVIKSLPSSEPRMGEWIEHEDPCGFFDTIPVCSECGHTTKIRERYNFCPNCGADMRGKEE